MGIGGAADRRLDQGLAHPTLIPGGMFQGAAVQLSGSRLSSRP